ncbi:hypothetical protein P6F26_11255 [Roseibacterium sp. SDUM158017]|uniref:hypothetical protein n=1 Tax=Roseicyclus salinarum TaxID=3036773 RepID=UPI0024157A5B|nr:hypothetical protein [Roseibacterium sp. SDUM158017]MDG4649022.1 hypothetical protein [Roseibacterium sp. SDUM158017]
MPEDRKPSPLELGLYARTAPEPRVTTIEIVAAALTVVWLVTVIAFGFGEDGGGTGGFARAILAVLAVLLPVALIWVAAVAARTARALRQEAARLQASVDAMRVAFVEQQQTATLDLKPDLMRRLEDLVAAQVATEEDGQPATFTSLRALAPPETRAAVVVTAPDPEVPQATLAFAAPEQREPISVADFIKAMNFPENEHDKDGFRTLRRALEDPSTERLVRASQDVLTLLSQDGIYMDDLSPDRARPEVWRRFALGERGRAVAALGGVYDRSSLVLAAGRMKKDPVFRDAAHHFLRHFDRTFMEFEKHASDEEIARLADTRTARAFMLLGRVTGTFD